MTEDNQTSDYVDNQPSPAPLSAEKVEVNTELSKVASNPKRNMVIMAVFGLVFAYIVYQIIASQQPNTPPPPPPLVAPVSVFKPGTTADKDSSAIPAVPELPKIVRPTVIVEDEPVKTAAAPTAPAPPPALPEAPAIPAVDSSIKSSLPSFGAPEDITNNDKRLEAKRKSSMFLINGKPETLTAEEVKIKADFTYRGNLAYVLGRGKIIDAVLESAINSDFPGEVLALVSRDVYSESGKVILVPKGSRIIGSFSASAEGGYGRVSIAWSRIDLPSGYSLTLSSDAVDNLGRKGVQGRVDNKYKEQFANAVLSSAFKIALATGLDKVVPPPPTTTSTALQTSAANSVSTIIGQISGNTAQYPTAAAQISALCAQIPPALAGSSVLPAVTAACTTAQTSITPDTALPVLITALNGAASGLATTAAQATTPTQAQQAAQDAYKDIGNKVSDILTKDETFTPTITLNQGEHIKIYVNKDYLFPRQALSNAKVMQ